MLVSFSIKKMIPETALEIANWLGDKANSFLEDLGLKEKRVDNSIYDRRIKDLYYQGEPSLTETDVKV